MYGAYPHQRGWHMPAWDVTDAAAFAPETPASRVAQSSSKVWQVRSRCIRCEWIVPATLSSCLSILLPIGHIWKDTIKHTKHHLPSSAADKRPLRGNPDCFESVHRRETSSRASLVLQLALVPRAVSCRES